MDCTSVQLCPPLVEINSKPLSVTNEIVAQSDEQAISLDHESYTPPSGSGRIVSDTHVFPKSALMIMDWALCGIAAMV